MFVAEGWRAVERALRSGLRIVECYECPELPAWSAAQSQAVEQLIADYGATPARFTLTAALMGKAAYCENPEGVLGVFVAPATDLAGLDQRIAAVRRDGHPSAAADADLVLVIVGAEKPGNIGAMARTADAAGVTALVIADPIVDLFNPNAIRASTGAIFALPAACADAAVVRDWLMQRRVAAWAAAPPLPGRRARMHTQIDWRSPSAIVIGPEDAGLDEAWLDPAFLAACHGGLASIPMHSRTTDSLNASVAAAVLLFEARRQRGQA